MYTYEEFLKSDLSLVILCEGEIVFSSSETAIKPLIRFIEAKEIPTLAVTIFDRYVGRAAALLMAQIRPILVKTPVVSEAGEMVLVELGIPFEADERVKYLMGVASEDMCRWEKMSLGMSPEQFWLVLEQSGETGP